MKSYSFPPIAGPDSRILILGSLPGSESLRQQQYYAHPRNLFWPIIHEVIGIPDSKHYLSRTQALKQHRIALWDVCHSAHRPGSLDSNISLVVPNAIDEFIDDHPNLKVIAFNGQKTASLYRQNFSFRSGITYLTMLSTSPANASFSKEAKIADWKRILMV